MESHRASRSIKEIERAFREIGIPEEKWQAPAQPRQEEAEPEPQIFIRTNSTTTPIKDKPNADLA